MQQIATAAGLRYASAADLNALLITQTRLREAFGPAPSILYLQADICRRELLLEIEVVCTTRRRSS